MMTLLAYTPDERWAFVRDVNRIVLVRPPFRHDMPASEAEVERAVTIHGFVALERDFTDRRSLLDFLGSESVRAANERAPSRDLPALRDELLAAFTVADLDRHIERAQKKIDAGKLGEAQALLSRLVTAVAITHAQRRTIGALQERVQSTQLEQTQQRQSALRAAEPTRFRRAAKPPNKSADPRGSRDAEDGVLRPAA
jgi:hypothetical protein